MTALVTLEQTTREPTFATANRAEGRKIVERFEVLMTSKARPIKRFSDVTFWQTKVTHELRKRMIVGHLFADVCR